MANLPETPEWVPGITQIETNEPVLGGPDGVDNRALIQLGNRTAWLKAGVEAAAAAVAAIDTSGFALINGDYALLRARGTTKADVGLGLVPNFPAATDPASASASELATMAMLAALRAELAVAAQTLVLTDEKPSGTPGPTPVAGLYNARDLNTVRLNTIPGASLAANRFVLPAGAFLVSAVAVQWTNAGRHRLRLWNVTAGAPAIIGMNGRMGGAGGTELYDTGLDGHLSLAAPATFELQHWVGTASAEGFGQPLSIPGENEVYARVTARRLG